MTGFESGCDGRGPIHSVMPSFPRPGNRAWAWRRTRRAMAGSGGASVPANSAMPPARTPSSIGVTAMCRSTEMIPPFIETPVPWNIAW